MGELWTTGTGFKHTPQCNLVRYVYDTGIGTAADTLTLVLGSVGIKKFMGMVEHLHTTAHSVVKPVSPADFSTTAVASGVLTVTLGTGNGMIRVFEIIGRSEL